MINKKFRVVRIRIGMLPERTGEKKQESCDQNDTKHDGKGNPPRTVNILFLWHRCFFQKLHTIQKNRLQLPFWHLKSTICARLSNRNPCFRCVFLSFLYLFFHIFPHARLTQNDYNTAEIPLQELFFSIIQTVLRKSI